MKARLFCKTGIFSGKAIDIADNATIGRSADNDLELDAQIISSQHARIHFDKNDNCYYLEDLRSRNGTNLDGMPVTQKKKLGKMHVITFAENLDFIFQIIDHETPAARKSETQKEPASKDRGAALPSDREPREKPLQPPPAPGLGRTIIDDAVVPFPRLTKMDKPATKGLPDQDIKRTVHDREFTAMPPLSEAGESRAPAGLSGQGPGRTMIGHSAFIVPDLQSDNAMGNPPSETPAAAQSHQTPTPFLLEVEITGKGKRVFPLEDGENLIGRSQECAIRLEDSSLSLRHAVMTVKGEKVMVRDLESKKHTVVDKQRLTSEVEVRPDMKIEFGAVKAQLVRKA